MGRGDRQGGSIGVLAEARHRAGGALVEQVAATLPEAARESFRALIEDPPADVPAPERPEPGSAPLPQSAPRVIGVCGKPRAGKDFMIDRLVQYYGGIARMAYSDAILIEANDALRAVGVREIHEGNKSDPLPRRFLQDLGLGRREEEGPGYWADMVRRRAGQLMEDNRLVIVSGLRVEADLEPFRRLGGEVWRVDRPGNPYQAEHEIESKIDELPVDRVIVNDGDAESLFRKARAALETPLSR